MNILSFSKLPITQQNLSNTLFTKTQQRVLGLLYGAPNKSFYTNEIVRIAAVGRGTVTRELVKLEKVGVLSVSAAGNRKHYRANSDCPLYAELVRLARKLFDIERTKCKDKTASKVKEKPKSTMESAKAKQKVLNPPAEKTQSVIEKEVFKADADSAINITIDEEGQLGFF